MNGRSRRHVTFAWAWPKGSIDQLLRAAAHVDEQAAQEAWRQWVHENDLDDVGLNEMRLLAAVAPRLDWLDPTQPDRNRIVGIGRSLWSRSQMVLREVQPALESLRNANIEMMVLKGAGRVARDPAALKFRFVNDVDVLVRPHEFRRAFDLLDAAGWRSTTTGSAHFHRTLLDRVHGLNLIRGDLGDLDLHRSAIHQPHQSPLDDERMWARADSGSLFQCPVRVPSATDTIIVALAHGGCGGHRTSDWMLDIVDAIDRGAVDWDFLSGAIQRRQLEVPAAVTWSYLSKSLHSPVPPEMLDWVMKRAKRKPLELMAGLLLSHPKNDFSRPLKLARTIAKMWRLRGRSTDCSQAVARATRCDWPLWKIPSTDLTPPAFHAPISPPDREPGRSWQGVVEAMITLPVPEGARRIEFELNVGTRHVARIKHRKWIAHAKQLTLRFRVAVELFSGEGELILEAAPGRGLRPNAPVTLSDRYARLPFKVLEVKCRSRAA